jgi:hypothetical protein
MDAKLVFIIWSVGPAVTFVNRWPSYKSKCTESIHINPGPSPSPCPLQKALVLLR